MLHVQCTLCIYLDKQGSVEGVWGGEPFIAAVSSIRTTFSHTLFLPNSSISKHPKEYISTGVDRFAQMNISGAL